MKPIDTKSLETAFLAPSTPSLADCLVRVESASELEPIRRRDLASGLRRLAQVMRQVPDEIPADPVWLRPRLARIAPRAHRLSDKTWSNILSNVRAALQFCGVVERRTRQLTGLSPLWAENWSAIRVSGDQSLAPALGRFVRFLDNLQVPPQEVSEQHLEAYQTALKLNELRRDPATSARQAASGWNLAAQRISIWPKRRLALQSRSKTYALPQNAYPDSFALDLHRYLKRLSDPDPLDNTAPPRPLRPPTIQHHRAQILRFAAALVHSRLPADEITSLAVLCKSENVHRGLRWVLARNGEQATPSLQNLVVLLQSIARHYAGSVKEDTECISGILRRLDISPARGLTEKNRERLRQFDDPAALQRLLVLPERLMERARTTGVTYKSCLMTELAVAIAILRHCPIRRTNLTELHLERNLRRLNGGKTFLVFEPSNVKNARAVEFELPQGLVKIIDEHVARRAGLLCPKGTPWLFPRRDGAQPIDKSSLMTRLSAAIRKETGLEVNPHLFRHLSAKILLEAHPGHYEVVRRLLGHAELSSTLNAYAGFEAGTATRLFAELVDKARGVAP